MLKLMLLEMRNIIKYFNKNCRELPVKDKATAVKSVKKESLPGEYPGRDSFFTDFYYNIPKKIGGI